MGRRMIFGIMIGALVLMAAPVSAAGRGTPSENATGYWTAERVQGAQPLDVVIEVGRGEVTPRPKPDKPGKPDKGDGGTTDPPADTSIVTGASWPDTIEGDPVDDLVGKVLFTLGGTSYVCSASSIAPSSGDLWVVMTAGHCTWDDSYGWATNWVFVPDYETVLEFGCVSGNSAGSCYAAASLHPTAEWRADGTDYLHDVAFARMANPLPVVGEVSDKDQLPVLRTSTTVGTSTAVGAAVTALGYPAAKKYSGSDLVYCSGTATTLSGTSAYSDNPMLACDMTGGSSGGPWYSDTEGILEATSLNSFGLRGYNGYMFGPAFDKLVGDALDAASTPST
jgi:V8-like Glu-specific endopeptidase